MSWALTYWSVDVEEGSDEVDEADEEGESDNGEGIGDGAQWTVFLDAGVAAMRVNVSEFSQSDTAWRVNNKQVTWSRQ